jgi:ABC-2 type transport system ATP-binding protein
MSVIQYLEYVASLRAIPEELQKERIIEAVEKTALGAKANSLISTLSKGYKQRVGVAQAILHRPEILILDEPTNGLDPSQIQEMRSLVTTLSEGATVILSTHILQEVQATCDRVLIMLHGKLARDARLDELQSSNRLVLSVSGSEEDVVKNLVDLSGVSDVQFLGNGGPANQFAVATGDSTEELAPRLAKKVIESGWELYSLAPEQRNLETVFREINSGAGGN